MSPARLWRDQGKTVEARLACGDGNGRRCAPDIGSSGQRKVHSAIDASQIAQAQTQRRITIAGASHRMAGSLGAAKMVCVVRP
jgi:hypothetical protein